MCSYANGDAISDQLLQPLRRNAVTDRHSDTQTDRHSDIWKMICLIVSMLLYLILALEDGELVPILQLLLLP